ncbi:MAG TPA: PIG-L deacetylase family protein [Candidatus Paceibacterota bacterium]|nr:PIG-L deacetylase family protein [Candidatus Paceibacterota bacterium]
MPPKKNFLGKRIVVFTAHPDDEGLAAGTMYANHQAGGETFLICATYGEKGKSHLEKPVSDAALKRIRKDEMLAAAKILKIDEVLFLGFPDAEVRENSRKLFEMALPIIRRIAPDQILSFGPDGVSAHWDHITVGSVALRIAKKLKVPMAAFTLSAERIAVIRKGAILSRRKFGKYAGIPKHRKGDIQVKVDLPIKRRAMRLHVSQFGAKGQFSLLPKNGAETAFRYEHFVDEKIRVK